MKRCYTCEHWHTTRAWRGNCRKHPWSEDRYSQDATAGDCPDYVDRYAKYQVAAKKET